MKQSAVIKTTAKCPISSSNGRVIFTQLITVYMLVSFTVLCGGASVFSENPVLSEHFKLQCRMFITLCLGSIQMGQVINEVRYKGTILQRNFRKMTILWSFSYNSVVKSHVRKMEVTSDNATVFVCLI